jgi:Cu(I)/Ag(I) efflux system membrane fusion protein
MMDFRRYLHVRGLGRGLGAAAILAAVALGAYMLGARSDGRSRTHGDAGHDETPEAAASEATEWTCSMHPSIRSPNPGACSLCGMDLIPVRSTSDSGFRGLELSESARKLAGIQVVPVRRGVAERELRMVGRVEYDETRLATITSRVPGRLDRLYVDYTGVAVREGEHLVSIYSPAVLTAQQELIQALRTIEQVADGPSRILRDSAEVTLEAARDKLRLWGLTGEQVQNIEESQTPSDHVTVYAPMGGIVVHKDAVEGMYVDTGTRIYTIADLTQVWVKLDAYESDLPWLRYGQQVGFRSEAFPGEEFEGRIAFVDPLVDARTRTVSLRVNVPNQNGRLKPGMFVRGTVRAALTAEGRVLAPDLSGKWISPMHPEIVKDEPGTCDICGMPLVRAESLGFVTDPEREHVLPLVIPATAPLLTGTRAVVYVQVPDEPGRFEGRVVELGPKAGGLYVVAHGLEEDELVAAQGAFRIDSALQILARPSMMTPQPDDENSEPEGDMEQTHRRDQGAGLTVTEAFTTGLEAVVNAYLTVQTGLSQDRIPEVAPLLDALVAVDAEGLSDEARTAWDGARQDISQAAEAMAEADRDNEAVRRGFALLSNALAAAVTDLGTGLRSTLYLVQCPMAFENRGATWLQDHDRVENPYFGSAMFRCGEVIDTLHQADGTQDPEGAHQGGHAHD